MATSGASNAWRGNGDTARRDPDQTPEERSARKAVQARWAKAKAKKGTSPKP